ncbi:uncharacterized protein [Populus alba]|uniref:uncharacterized protein n=1 Tax=Populus alba TaxID=43335 RepID=UPI00158E3F7D|nr:uncharacterized protein LOC118036731 [Populus alba]
MEHEERAHLESRYQSELESLKSEVSRMSNLLEQLLKAKSGEGTSAQPSTSSPISHIPIASPILGADSVTEQHFAPAIPIRPAHTLPTVDLTMDGPVDSRSSNFISQDKIFALEERLRAVEGNDWFDPTRAADVCLVPNIMVPKDFRIPEFTKYTGLECPNTHLRSYCNKMAEVIHNDKMLIYFFQDSLSGSVLNWYMRLETVKIKTWKDLVEAFLKQYKFNLEIAPDRTSLMSMEKRSQETVRVYAQRWRDEATHVQPPLIETKMVTLFANTFKAPYYEHLMGSSSQHFYDVVRVAERIEQGIKARRIPEPLEKKGFSGRRREGDVNNLEGGYKGKRVNYPNPGTSTPQFTNMNFTKPLSPNPTNRINIPPNIQNNYQKPYTRYTSEQLPPLPMPLKDLYAKLLSIGQITPIHLPQIQPPFPMWYKSELACEYHAGNSGHAIETCYAFKRKLLELIKMGWVSFEDPPNVISNPLSKHTANSSGVGMIEIGNQGQMLKVSMKRLYDMLLQSGFLNISTTCQLGSDNYCEFHRMEGHHIEDCVKFRQKVAKMLLMGELRLETLGGNQEVSMMEGQDKLSEVCRVQPMANGFSKLILTKPSFTKRDHSAMPYNYVCTSNIQAPLPLFHSEVSGLTRSGRCFTPEELKKVKGKEMVDLDKEVEVNEPVTEKESNEFLKLIKHSEYCIVDQLKKTPARISLMSLILSSEPHRNALQKVLNEAYVPQDIEQKTMEHLVGRIHASNYLYFTADELSAEGTGHNKPLYITVKCKDFLIGKVLVDNGSALNVLPKYILKEMPVDESHMKPSTIMARAYDGSPRPVLGNLEIELYVGPQMFLTTFQVMDIHPSYKDCTDENLHAFEIVNTEWVPESTVLRKPKISAATKMVVRCFLEHGIPFQYDPITGIPKRIKPITMRAVDQRFGLGYKLRRRIIDMPGLNTNIVVHKIPLEEGCKPVKQKLRRAHPETWIKVKALNLKTMECDYKPDKDGYRRQGKNLLSPLGEPMSISYAVRFKERRCHLSKSYGDFYSMIMMIKKSRFRQAAGIVVKWERYRVDPDKAKAIQSMPTPKSEKEVEGIFGQAELYCPIHSPANYHMLNLSFRLLRKKESWDLE